MPVRPTYLVYPLIMEYNCFLLFISLCISTVCPRSITGSYIARASNGGDGPARRGTKSLTTRSKKTRRELFKIQKKRERERERERRNMIGRLSQKFHASPPNVPRANATSNNLQLQSSYRTVALTRTHALYYNLRFTRYFSRQINVPCPL